MQIRTHLVDYASLMRLDKPIGWLLLLWPTLWALWLANGGHPEASILAIFVAGVVLMRSVGCIVNDIADREFDKHVKRTRNRPITAGKISVFAAAFLAVLLAISAFLLVLLCNPLTIKLAFVGAFLALFYPYLKRLTHLPQVGLGAAFSWGVPMAFAATTNAVPERAWFLFLTAMIWPIIYDTQYAMADREDDLKIGVKSTAILFAHNDKLIIACLQIIFIFFLTLLGFLFHLKTIYFISLALAAMFFCYQAYLIKDRNPAHSQRAFRNNNWIGLVIFLGISLSFLQGNL